jgi:hypothetical protein
MARRKETTIESLYREVTGNKMPAAVKTRSSTQAKGQAA